MTAGAADTSSMSALKEVSTRENFWPSSGICAAGMHEWHMLNEY
jgi:hypothetical protein